MDAQPRVEPFTLTDSRGKLVRAENLSGTRFI